MIQHSGRFHGNSPGIWVLINAILFFLPAFDPTHFSWLNGFLSIPVFYIFYNFGEKQAINIVCYSLVACSLALLFSGSLPFLFFGLSFIPLGYAYFQSLKNNIKVPQTGWLALLILAVSWIILGIILSMGSSANIYSSLVSYIDSTLQQTYLIYTQDAKVSEDTLQLFKQSIEATRKVLPHILPGILLCIAVFTVWINLIICNLITAKKNKGIPHWGLYTSWRLPDHLIWLFIGSLVGLLVMRGNLQDIFISLFMVSVLIYFFQGLAVFLHLLDKWNVPIFFRLIIYGMLILQSYGIFILSVLGISDVWLNIRKLPEE